jgi:hypothetical protein
MTTEIATYAQQSVAQQQATMQTAAVQRLGDWAHSAAAAYEVAVGLVDTSFVPQQFRGKPQEATAAILSGAEVGLSPMASLKSFDIIQGTAAPRALTLRAIVQSQGHEMIVEESTTTRCKMRGKRRGSSEWVKVSWTIDRAKALGLTSKDNWKKQPDAMLVARATGELARLIAADAILGIGYTIEELTDDPSVAGGPAPEMSEPEVPAPTARTMQRAPKDAPADPPQDEPTTETGEGMSAEQQKKMFAQFGELGIKERDDYRDYISKVIGIEVESSKDLTKDQAHQVIEAQIVDLEAAETVAAELPVEES